MDLSIIIPVYNTPVEALARCLASIENIANIKKEIIIVNDGSTDELTLSYNELTTKETTLYNKTNGGVSSARNFGIEKAKGKYIMFVDSDDILFENIIDEESIAQDFDIIFYNEAIVSETGKILEQKELCSNQGPISSTNILKQFIISSAFHSPCSKLYKRQMITDHKIRFNTEMIQGEDAIFNLNILKTSPTCLYKDKVLYGYYYQYTNSQNRLKNNPTKRIENAKYLFEEMYKVNSEFFSNDNYLLQQIYNRYIRCMFTICTELLNLKLPDTKELLINVSNDIEMYYSSNIKYPFSTRFKKFLIKKNIWALIKFLSVVRNIKLKTAK